jgi:hypothetical protein
MEKLARRIITFGLSMSLVPLAVLPAHAADNCETAKTISLLEVATYPSMCVGLSDKVSVSEGFEIAVPLPGESRRMSVLFDDGSSLDANVHRDSDGSLGVEVDGEFYGPTRKDFAETPLSASASNLTTSFPNCSYSSYVRQSSNPKWSSTHLWRYNSTSEVNTSSLSAIRTGLNTWRSGTNQCTLNAYTTSFPSGYLGQTSILPSGGASGCGWMDGQNEVGWRPLASGVLGVTCASVFGSTFAEADVTFTTSVPWFSSTGTLGCANQFDLVSVATHEFGHVLGLDHVPAGTGQVMVPGFGTCQLAYRRLGAGDLAGVTAVYP